MRERISELRNLPFLIIPLVYHRIDFALRLRMLDDYKEPGKKNSGASAAMFEEDSQGFLSKTHFER